MSLSQYALGLSPGDRNRYIDKLKKINNVDPYILSSGAFDTQCNLPSVSTKSVMDYLLFKASPFTQQEMRAYKSMEAYSQVVCEWIKDIKTKQFGESFLILGKVLHSQKINEPPLKPWLVLNKDGEIDCAHCDCVAGLGEVCTHVAAMLFAIQKRGNESVTDRLAYWIGRGKKDLHLALSAIDFSTPKSLWENSQKFGVTKVINNENPKINRDAEKRAAIDFLVKYKAAGCHSVLHTVLKPFISVERTVLGNHKEGNQEIRQIEKNVFNFYSKNFELLSLHELQAMGDGVDITISNEDCLQIEEQTRQQNKSGNWFQYRKGRITASNFRAVCHTKKEKPAISLVKKICYPQVIKFKQGEYGCRHERDALDAYLRLHCDQHPSAYLQEVGLIISPDYPQFGATPDSIVNCDVCGKGCVEVKCPYCLGTRNASVQELADIKGSCLIKEDGKLILKKTHAYYYQIQMQLALSGAKYCDFLVWSPKDTFWDRIFPDEVFWEEKKNIAISFFRDVLMPEMLAKYFTRFSEKDKSASSSVICNIIPSINQIKSCCYCNGQETDEMVKCKNVQCKIKLFHKTCVHLNSVPKSWYCLDCKK